MRFKVFLLALALVTGTGHTSEPHQTPTSLSLMNDPLRPSQTMSLSDEEWRWLRQKRKLVLGISLPSTKPFDITLTKGIYQGMTADVVGLLGELLNLRIDIRQYNDRQSAIAALEQGEIDLLGSANNYDKANSNYKLVLSQPYVIEQASLFSRISDRRTFGTSLSDMKIAMVYNYLPPKVAREAFPGAIIQTFNSRQQALGALAFGQADLYLGDNLSSNLLLNENFFNYINFERSVDIDTGGISFAIKDGNERLLMLVNKALTAFSKEQQNHILKRWGGGTGTSINTKINFTPEEQQWIDAHPRLLLVINHDQAPVAFISARNNFSGITADLLKLVTIHTGIQFDVQQQSDLGAMIESASTGDADLILLSPSLEREKVLRFSYPFISNPYALITQIGARKSASISQMKTIAIPSEHVIIPDLKKDYPDMKIIETSSLLTALDMVQRGDADATIAELNVAQYYTSHLFNKTLKITEVLDEGKASFAFSMARANTELQSIINKVLLSIAPDEMTVLHTRWRDSSIDPGLSLLDYRPMPLHIILTAAMLIIISLVWSRYLLRQIAKRKSAEEALANQLRLKKVLINGTPHPMYVRDKKGRLVACNNFFLQAIERTREQVIGKTLLESKDSSPETIKFHDDYMMVMEQEHALEMDRELTLNGKKMNVYHWIYPYRDIKGDVQGVVCGWIDISERRALLEQLKSAKEEADAANRAKSTFLATMSHEIRTPMSAVIGMLELSLKQQEEQGNYDREAIEVAYDAAQGLLLLIGDILDIVRIESGRFNISPQRANIRELIESVVRVFDGLARQKSLSLHLEIDPITGCDVLVDPVRFKQILSNLISNAIKFTERGKVSLRVQGTLMDEDRLQLQLWVEDTGIGISSEEQRRLFQPFVQGSQPRNTAKGGTGLGLVICRSLCEMMGGTLTLSSVLGQGTQVNVNLILSTLTPLPPKTGSDESPAMGKNKTLRILVVDDHPVNRMMISRQLRYLGHDCEEEADGDKGFNTWQKSIFDVVITDCSMPVMSGYDLARHIRQAEIHRQQLPCTIIGFTANAQQDALEKCIAAGMDDCLFKPVSLAQLNQTLTGLKAQILPITEATSFTHTEPPIFDLSAAEQLAGRNSELMKELLTDLINSNRADLAQIQQLSVANERQLLLELAHRIKGPARMIDAHELVDACDTLELLCEKLETDNDEIHDQIEFLEQAILHLEMAISKYLQ